MNFETLYLKLPVLLQKASCSLYGQKLIKRRYSKVYRILEKDIFGREFWPSAELEVYSSKRLRSIIRYAATHVPYHKRLFAAEGIKPEGILKPKDLSVPPVLEKNTVQANRSEFSSDELERRPHSIWRRYNKPYYTLD